MQLVLLPKIYVPLRNKKKCWPLELKKEVLQEVAQLSEEQRELDYNCQV